MAQDVRHNVIGQSLFWSAAVRPALCLWNTSGTESVILDPPMTNEERLQRESDLIATIRKKLPDFAKMCADDTELAMLHQDSFAADYQDEECMFLGTAIKYAGLRGKEVRVAGKNRSSLGEEVRIQ
jgi:hypothetical protein